MFKDFSMSCQGSWLEVCHSTGQGAKSAPVIFFVWWWWWWWWGWGCKACFVESFAIFLSIFLTGCSFGGDRSVCPSVVIDLFGRCLVFLCAFYCCPMAGDYPYMDNEWSKRKGGVNLVYPAWIFQEFNIWFGPGPLPTEPHFLDLKSLTKAMDISWYTVYIHQNQHLCWGWSSTQ